MELRCLTDANVNNMAKRITSLVVAQGGARFGEIYINRLKALGRWVKASYSTGDALDGNKFSEDHLDEQQDLMTLGTGPVDDLKEPPKFKALIWVLWSRSLSSYLSSLESNVENIPLAYVIRKDINPAMYAFINETKRRMYAVCLSGQA